MAQASTTSVPSRQGEMPLGDPAVAGFDLAVPPSTVFRGAFESMAVGMALMSLDGHWLEVNRAFCELLGYGEEELLASPLDWLVHGDEPSCHEWKKLIAGGDEHRVVERRLKCRDGRTVSVQLTFSVIRNAEDEPSYCTVQVQDLTERKATEAELRESEARFRSLADSDPLTGMLNRRSYRDEFKREWARALRYGRALACIMLDIDFFKRINDAHGHAGGDAVLKRLAEVLIRECRPSDRVCRYGGEEFCILAPETDEDGAAALAERLREALAAARITLADNVLSITGSLGVAERMMEMDDPEQLIERADRALYIAKHSGRNRVVRFATESALAEVATDDHPLRILSHFTAGDLAVAVTPIRFDATVAKAVDALLTANLEAAPVVDAGGKLIGFICERDLMTAEVSAATWARPVHEFVKSGVACYEDSAPGHQVFQHLCRVSVRQAAVVRAGVPIGMITPGSLLRFLHLRAARPSNV